MPQFRPQQYLLLHLTKATNTQKQMTSNIALSLSYVLTNEQLFHGGKVFENNLLATEW